MGVARAALTALVALAACRGQDRPPAARPTGQTIRVAVIGGMIETGFWPALANQHRVVERAAALSAYTLVGRIPWITGKLRGDGVELLVQGDPRLRRPYLVEVSAAATPAALDLAAYLRSPETQQWIAGFGRGRHDDQPLFFPVSLL